jgi:hypothetical protein
MLIKNPNLEPTASRVPTHSDFETFDISIDY